MTGDLNASEAHNECDKRGNKKCPNDVYQIFMLFNGTILAIPENFTDAFVTENPCVPKAPGRKNYVNNILLLIVQ